LDHGEGAQLVQPLLEEWELELQDLAGDSLDRALALLDGIDQNFPSRIFSRR
jgi:hypothetical protein